MTLYDLGLSFVWEFDDDFINLLETSLHEDNISTFRIGYYNFKEAYNLILNRKLSFNYYLDRAWDVDSGFEAMGKIITRRKTKIFNPYKNVLHAIDKASMHLEFITAGLEVPHSIIIPPHSHAEKLSLKVDDLSKLKRPFIIKPCNTTGGGVGVVTGAETLKEILDERINLCDDKYILQEKIYPKIIDEKRAWFRCFWAFGKAIPVWWDDQTHIYEVLNNEDLKNYNLNRLKKLTKKIASITKLNFFSTEIVLTPEDKFVVIDYVNDQCDMRLKSQHRDGVPDEVVEEIILSLKKLILRHKRELKKDIQLKL